MDIETIFGLPAHPLLVHVPVVLIPLCAAGAVWIVVWPSWRQRIGWIVVVLSGFTVVMSKLAADSGEALEDALDRESSLLERHTELGDTFVWFALAFLVAVLALMLWDRAQRRKADPSGGSTGRGRATIAGRHRAQHPGGGDGGGGILPRLPGGPLGGRKRLE